MTVLITPEQRAQLLANGAAYRTDKNFDPLPVALRRSHNRLAVVTWL